MYLLKMYKTTKKNSVVLNSDFKFILENYINQYKVLIYFFVKKVYVRSLEQEILLCNIENSQ